MKMTNSALLSGLLAILISFSLTAQEDTKNTPSDSHSNEDSLSVVVPAEGVAELSMITPPEGFEPTDLFNGYLHTQASSGIIMTLIDNANYVKISEGMNDAFYKSNGLEFIEKKDFVSNNKVHGSYFKCSFVTSETPFVRYMVYAGDLNTTLWLNITYPKQIEHLIEGEILETIQSITLKPARDEE
ncbi:MAG: hypothetical protein AB8B56_10640 [Crocinitomicaceae bacterium]